MSAADSEEYRRMYLRLRKEVEEAQQQLLKLKELGYDINSIQVKEATEVW